MSAYRVLWIWLNTYKPATRYKPINTLVLLLAAIATFSILMGQTGQQHRPQPVEQGHEWIMTPVK